MKVTYLQAGKKKLVSLSRHDFRTHQEGDNSWMIDGGQEGYVRFSATDGQKPQRTHIGDLIEDIREHFKWGVSTGSLVQLSNLETDHILNIITHIVNRDNQTNSKLLLNIFTEELKYRFKHRLI